MLFMHMHAYILSSCLLVFVCVKYMYVYTYMHISYICTHSCYICQYVHIHAYVCQHAMRL